MGKKVAIKGFFRLQIVGPGGKIAGKTEWIENTITNHGFDKCLCAAPIGASGSKQAASLVLGSGAVASDDTVLASSNSDHVTAFDSSTVVSSLTARMSADFDGANGSMASIKNIGVIDSASSLIAGQTITSSAFATDQTLNATYELRYATA